MDRLDALYNRAGFNDETKLVFLRVSVTKVQPVATFAMYRRVSNYAQLFQAAPISSAELAPFHAVSSVKEATNESLETKNRKDVQLLVRPVAGVQNMKAKIYTLADQLTNLTLILKKSQS